MDFQQFGEFCKAEIAKKPELKEDIMDLFELCFDEIENGESEEHEIELAVEAIKQLTP